MYIEGVYHIHQNFSRKQSYIKNLLSSVTRGEERRGGMEGRGAARERCETYRALKVASPSLMTAVEHYTRGAYRSMAQRRRRRLLVVS